MSARDIQVGTLAVICIDVQNDFVSHLDRRETDPAVLAMVEIVDTARRHEVPVVFIQEVHKPSLKDMGRELDGAEGVHCLEGEPGTELIAALQPRPSEYHIRKRRYSAFFATELDLVLRSLGADTLVLVGALTDVCVHYTAADAHQHGYRIRVVSDATVGSSPNAHEAAMEAMAYLQRDAPMGASQVLSLLAAQEVGAAESHG